MQSQTLYHPVRLIAGSQHFGRGVASGITDPGSSLGSATGDWSDSGQLESAIINHFPTAGPLFSWLPTPPNPIILSGCCLAPFAGPGAIYLEVSCWDHSRLRPKPTSLHPLTLSRPRIRRNCSPFHLSNFQSSIAGATSSCPMSCYILAKRFQALQIQHI